jgi:DNA polymerase III delta prime subunit
MTIHDLQSARDLHHGYIVVGPLDDGREATLTMLQGRGISVKGNPDLLSLSFTDLGIEDVRESILPFASLSPIRDSKYILISFSRANDSSQNALLKAVEESLGRTTFFFLVENAGYIIPTLRSRCVTVRGPKAERSLENHEAEGFLKETYAERLARVESLVRTATNSDDRTPVRAFTDDLLLIARGKKLGHTALRDILSAAGYMRMQGSSIKAVLSHLAVTLPRVK